MKTGKRVMSILLIALMLLTAAPLSGFVGLELAPKAEAYSVGDHIEFGTYPQSKVAETPALKNAADTATWKSYGYYTGTGGYNGQIESGNWMQFADFFCNGNKYRAVQLSQYRPIWTTDPSSSQMSYQDNNGYVPSTTYYFKYEPLSWRILDPSTGYVMCENIIDSQAFQNIIYTVGGSEYQGSSSSKAANDYAYSSIRKWLNYDFYETAFTTTQKNNIKATTIDNKGDYEIAYQFASTNDHIFLLSEKDTENSNYGFLSASVSSSTRRAKGTDYAKCQGLYVYESSGSSISGNSFWWLRTPGVTESCSFASAYIVDYMGRSIWDSVESTHRGVRPACCLSALLSETTESDSLFSSDGSGHSFITSDEPIHPENYDFNRDSYSFLNKGTILSIGKKYYNAIFYPGHSKTISEFAKKQSAGKDGLCFGMTYTTGSILNDLPNVGIIEKNPFTGIVNNWCTSLQDVQTASRFSINKTNGESLILSVKDYICYAHIYQYSTQLLESRNFGPYTGEYFREEDLKRFYHDIAELITQNKFAHILIRYYPNFKANSNNFESHSVLAVGFEGNDILINDPNSPGILQKIEIKDDYSGWTFSNSWKNNITMDQTNSLLWSSTDLTQPYYILRTGNKVEYEEDSAGDNAGYVLGTERLDGDKLLFYSDGSNFDLSVNHCLEVDETSSNRQDNDLQSDREAKMFWIFDDKNVNVTNTSGINQAFSLSGRNKIVKVQVPDGDTVDLTVDEDDNDVNARINSQEGKDYSVGITEVDELKDTCIQLSGKASGSVVNATRIDDGIAVFGLNDMTVAYSENEEVVSETTVNVKDGRKVYITIDESNNSMVTDYVAQPHTHTYTSAITTDPTCTTDGEATYTCSVCGDTYTEPIPATGDHVDDDNDGYCDTCDEMMQGGDHCKYCGKIHDGAFGWLVKFFHSIFAIFKR